MKTMRNIPAGWMEYTPIGNQVPGTRFIAFKVPLRENYVDKLKPDSRFTVPILLERVPELGLIIDLTQTVRYYNKNEVLDRGVDYVKIPTPGQAVPTQQYVDRFFEVVDYYLDTHKGDDSLIGVHCTHGVNRTGYMLCRYLIQRLDYPVEEAIAAVGSARGHPIERTPYLISLRENRESTLKKSTRGDLEEGKSKMSKKSIIKTPKKSAESRPMMAGKERFSRRDEGYPPLRDDHRSRSPPRGGPFGDFGGDRAMMGREPPVHMRGRTPPPHHMRGRTPPPHHMRGRTPPPHPRGRTPPPHHMRRTPPPPHPRGRTPPPNVRERTPPPHPRGRTPPPHQRGRTPPYMSAPSMAPPMQPYPSHGRSPSTHPMRGRSPPPQHHLRGRSPPPSRGRTPPHIRGGPTPPPNYYPHQEAGRPPARRSPPPHLRERSPPYHPRGRSPPARDQQHPLGGFPRRESVPAPRRSPPRRDLPPPHDLQRGDRFPPGRRTPPPVGRHEPPPPRAHSPPPARREPPPPARIPPEEYYRADYRGAPSGVSEANRDYPPPSKYQSREQSYGAEAGRYNNYEGMDYYYGSQNRNRSRSPHRRDEGAFYPDRRKELTPPREVKRRRKSPPPVRGEKPSRPSPPRYGNGRDQGGPPDRREGHPEEVWNRVQQDYGPDCREILNERRSMRDPYQDPEYEERKRSLVERLPPKNVDLRESLEEEKRRKQQGYGEAYPGGEFERKRGRREYPEYEGGYDQQTPGFDYRAESQTTGQDYGGRGGGGRGGGGRAGKRVFDRLARGRRGSFRN